MLHYSRHLFIRFIPILLFFIIFNALAAERVGRVSEVAGVLQITREEGSQIPRASVNEAVQLNDTVETQDKSTARITLNDETVLSLQQKSKVLISEFVVENALRNTTVEILSGRVKAQVRKIFSDTGARTEIRTPTAVVGIRGTELVLEVTRDKTKIYCLKGLIEVWSPDFPEQLVRVAAGMGTEVLLNQLPINPTKIPETILNEYVSGFSKLPDPPGIDKIKSAVPAAPQLPAVPSVPDPSAALDDLPMPDVPDAPEPPDPIDPPDPPDMPSIPGFP